MDLKVLREILIKNLLVAFKIPVLICSLIPIMAVMVFPSAGLYEVEASRPIEMLISFTGTILMSAVFLPEQDKAIRESVYCRKIGLEVIQLIRTIIAVEFIVLFVVGYCLYLRKNECLITGYMIWGGITSALFMGSISFFVASISENIINGILTAVVYYICNYGLRKQLGVFYLFSMSKGTFVGKTWLLFGGIILILFAFVIGKWKEHHQIIQL